MNLRLPRFYLDVSSNLNIVMKNLGLTELFFDVSQKETKLSGSDSEVCQKFNEFLRNCSKNFEISDIFYR